MKATRTIEYTNGAGRELKLTVEPWAESFAIAPSQKVQIVVEGDETSGHVEIEQTSEGLIVYGFVGSVISVFCDGEEVAPIDEA